MEKKLSIIKYLYILSTNKENKFNEILSFFSKVSKVQNSKFSVVFIEEN